MKSITRNSIFAIFLIMPFVCLAGANAQNWDWDDDYDYKDRPLRDRPIIDQLVNPFVKALEDLNRNDEPYYGYRPERYGIDPDTYYGRSDSRTNRYDYNRSDDNTYYYDYDTNRYRYRYENEPYRSRNDRYRYDTYNTDQYDNYRRSYPYRYDNNDDNWDFEDLFGDDDDWKDDLERRRRWREGELDRREQDLERRREALERERERIQRLQENERERRERELDRIENRFDRYEDASDSGYSRYRYYESDNRDPYSDRYLQSTRDQSFGNIYRYDD